MPKKFCALEPHNHTEVWTQLKNGVIEKSKKVEKSFESEMDSMWAERDDEMTAMWAEREAENEPEPKKSKRTFQGQLFL